MDFRRLHTPLAATTVALALAVTGCGSGSPESSGAWSAPASPSGDESSSLAPPSPSPTEASPSPSKPKTSPSARRPSSTPSRTRPGKTYRYVFPVGGKPVSYHRTHSGYPATDIFASCGLPVRAATDGVVLEVTRVDNYDKATDNPALRGGLSVSILGDDGVRYYGSHLTRVSGGINPRVRVRAGQQIGTVGKTGNASNTCHLHFGISPPCKRTGDWWVRRGVVWPWSYLDSWKAGGSRSPAGTVSGWKARNGCPSAP